jgi:NAD(P)-dependent dehydrogenase (short-subunit alcohol dehydrogenase family)
MGRLQGKGAFITGAGSGIARIALFLASDEARMITGVILLARQQQGA